MGLFMRSVTGYSRRKAGGLSVPYAGGGIVRHQECSSENWE